MAKYFKVRPIKGKGNILALEFSKEIPMGMMFMRFQEYSEGIKGVRDKSPMPEGDILYKYFKKTKKVYYKAGWAGFNLRGDLFLEYVNSGKFALNILEQKLVYLIRDEFDWKGLGNKFFIIAYHKGDKATKKHELLHALYYLNPIYRARVDSILCVANLKKARKYLKKLGYGLGGTHGDYIFYDEIQAYVLTDKPKIVKAFGLSKKVIRKLQALKREYY